MRGGSTPVRARARLPWLEWAPLLAIASVAAAARLWHLGTQSMWLDEAYGALTVQGDLSGLLHRVATREGAPPLYFLLVYPFAALGFTSEFAFRLPSAIFGVLTVCLVYALGNRLLGRAVGLVAAGLIAVSPFHVYLSQEARPFSLLALLTLASYLALLAALERRRPHLWALYGLASALSLYTHYFAVFTWLSQAAYVVWRVRRDRDVLKPWLWATAGTVVLCSPWAVVVARTLATMSTRGGQTWRPDVGGLLIPYTLFQFSLGFTTAEIRSVSDLAPHLAVLAAGTLAFGVPFAVGVWHLRRDRAQAALLLSYLVIPIAAAYAVSLRLRIYAPVYLIGVLPAYLLILAVGLTRMRPRLAGAVGAMAMAAFAVVALHNMYYDPRFQKEPWRVIAREIVAGSRPTDIILFHKSYLQTPFSRYYAGPLQQLPLPDRMLHDQSEARRLASRMAGDHRRAWLVTGHTRGAQDGYASLFGRHFQLVAHRRHPGLTPISVYLYELTDARAPAASRSAEDRNPVPYRPEPLLAGRER